MAKPRILIFAGSLRTDSFNKKLARGGMKAVEAAGAEVTWLDLRDLQLPVYDGDLEDAHGQPEGSLKLKALMKSHDGFFISSPEYNSSIPGGFKNAIDWASREVPDEKPLACFAGKVVGLVSASPGALGGLRSLMTVRSIFGNLYSIVIPQQFALSKAHEAFNDDGSLKDARALKSVETVAKSLVEMTSKLKA